MLISNSVEDFKKYSRDYLAALLTRIKTQEAQFKDLDSTEQARILQVNSPEFADYLENEYLKEQFQRLSEGTAPALQAAKPSSAEHRSPQELIQEALNSGISSIEAYTPQGLLIHQENKDHRPKPKIERLHVGLTAAFQGRFMAHLQQAGIFEEVIITPLERTVTKEVVDNPGIFGRGKKTHQESSQIPVTLDEELGKPSNNPQPAIAIYYYAADSGTSIFEERAFRDAFGRFGNSATAEIVLPSQLSRAISEEIQRNPKFIRELVDAFVRNKYPRNYVEESWDHYARPPYQAWDSRPADRRKFYFADLVSHPEDKHLTAEQAINKAVPY